MNINKKTIKFGISQLSDFYIDFNRFVELKGIDNLTDKWEFMFKSMEYDYEYAEQDFKSSIFTLITTSNKTPTFSDILDNMRELNRQHQLED